MMIETKGTKTAAGPEDGARKYAPQGSDARSGTPYYLALAVAALAAYLKSMFQGPAQAGPEAEGAAPAQAGLPRLVGQAPAEKELDEAPAEARLAGSAAVAAQPEPPASEYDSPQFLRGRALHFSKPDPQPNLNDFKASPVIPRPTNDNAGASSGGGHGGGGGGGGRSSDGTDTGTYPRPGPDGTPPAADEGDHEPVRPDGGGSGPPGKEPAGDGPDGPAVRRNRAPVATGPVLLADTTGCALLAIAMTDLLRNVQDPDGDALSVRNVSVSSGTLSRDGDGWVFDGDAVGPVTITYEVTDGALSVTQTASFNVVERNHLTGTGGDDVMLGTPCADAMDAGAGDDIVDARGGDDLIDGGIGNDHIVAGGGDDTVLGGAGDDVIFAGAGADVVSGGTGDDRIFGEAGADILFGDAGDDLLDGGDGDDVLMGGIGDDLLLGGAGDDRIDGGEGRDRLFGDLGRDVIAGSDGDDRMEGGGGDDVLSDGAGRDVALGQDGNDVLVAALDGEADVLDGGEGEDTLDLSATVSGVEVDLAAGTATGVETGHDALVSIEGVIGGTGADVLAGGGGGESLSGGDGDDHLSGGAGDDLLAGGAGRDTIIDGAGRDIVRAGAGDDRIALVRDGDDDAVDGGEGFDTLDLGGATGDLLVDLISQVVSGSDLGNDRIESIEGIVAGSGHDRFLVGDGDVVLTGGGGNDGYVFATGGGASEATRAVEITDFSVGDYVDLLRWTLFEDASDGHGQSLSEAMERNDGTVSGIQYRSAHLDDGDVTVISADLDHDDRFETTIILDGHHALLFVETPAQTPAPTVAPIA